MQPFYVRDGDRLVATPSTRGPWSPDHQHAGPPSALLVRAAEARAPGFELARITVEMLRPIPIGPMAVHVDVEKPGRKVIGLVGSVEVEGVPCLAARLVMVRSAEVGAPQVAWPAPQAAPEACPPHVFDFFPWPVGYHTATELRRASGTWGSGRMSLWMRLRVPVVDGEAPSGAQRVLVAADAGSGVSAALDTARFTFLNADLSVHLVRPLRGDWVLLDAATTVGPTGRALADTRIADVDGTVGRGAQTLVIEPR
jgi:hypothetical protein